LIVFRSFITFSKKTETRNALLPSETEKISEVQKRRESLLRDDSMKRKYLKQELVEKQSNITGSKQATKDNTPLSIKQKLWLKVLFFVGIVDKVSHKVEAIRAMKNQNLHL
jgi:hypothetical protein